MDSVDSSPMSSSNESCTPRFSSSDREKIRTWIEDRYKEYDELMKRSRAKQYNFLVDEVKLWIIIAANSAFEEYAIESKLLCGPGTLATDFSDRFISSLILMLMNPVYHGFKDHFRFLCIGYLKWKGHTMSNIPLKNQLLDETLKYKTSTARKNQLSNEEKKRIRSILFPRKLAPRSGIRASSFYINMMRPLLIASGYDQRKYIPILDNTFNLVDVDLKAYFNGLALSDDRMKRDEHTCFDRYMTKNSKFTVIPNGINEELADPAVMYFKSLKKSSQDRYKAESPQLDAISIAKKVYRLAPRKLHANFQQKSIRYIKKRKVIVHLPVNLINRILNGATELIETGSIDALIEPDSSYINPSSLEDRTYPPTGSLKVEESDVEIREELERIQMSVFGSEHIEEAVEADIGDTSGSMMDEADEDVMLDTCGSMLEEAMEDDMGDMSGSATEEEEEGDVGDVNGSMTEEEGEGDVGDVNGQMIDVAGEGSDPSIWDSPLPDWMLNEDMYEDHDVSDPPKVDEGVEDVSSSNHRVNQTEPVPVYRQYLEMMVKVMYKSSKIRPLTLVTSEPPHLDEKWRNYAFLSLSLSGPECVGTQRDIELLCSRFGFEWNNYFDKFVEMNRMNSAEPQLFHHFGFCSDMEEADSIFTTLNWDQEGMQGFICGVTDLIHSMNIVKVPKSLWINVSREVDGRTLIIPGENWSPFEKTDTDADSRLKYRLQAVILKETKEGFDVINCLIRTEDEEGHGRWTEVGPDGSKPASPIYEMYLRIFSFAITLVYVTEGLDRSRFMDSNEPLTPSLRIWKTQEVISEKKRLEDIAELRLIERIDNVDRFECKRNNQRPCLGARRMDKERMEEKRFRAEVKIVLSAALNKKSKRNLVRANMKLPEVRELVEFILKEKKIKIAVFKSEYIVKYDNLRLWLTGNGINSPLCAYCMSFVTTGNGTDKILPCISCQDVDYDVIMFVIRSVSNPHLRLPYLMPLLRDERPDRSKKEKMLDDGLKRTLTYNHRKKEVFCGYKVEEMMEARFEKVIEAETAAFAFKLWDWVYFRFVLKRKEEYPVARIEQSQLTVVDIDPVILKREFLSAAKKDGYELEFKPCHPRLNSNEREDMVKGLLCRIIRDKSMPTNVNKTVGQNLYSLWFKKGESWILYYGRSSGTTIVADYHYVDDNLERYYRLGWIDNGLIEQYAIANTGSRSVMATLEGSAQIVALLALMYGLTHSYKNVIPRIGNMIIETFGGYNLQAEPMEYLNLLLRSEFGKTLSFVKAG